MHVECRLFKLVKLTKPNGNTRQLRVIKRRNLYTGRLKLRLKGFCVCPETPCIIKQQKNNDI